MFRELVDATSHVLLVYAQQDLHLVFSNAAFERIFGLPRSSLSADASAWLALVHEEDRPRIEALVAARRPGAQPAALGDFCIRDPQGQVRWLQASIRPLYVAEGELRGHFWLELIHDVTEEHLAARARDAAAAALRDSEERLRRMSETMRESFFLTALDRSETYYVNEAFERLWGMSREEIRKNPRAFLESIVPEDRPRTRAMIREQIEDLQPKVIEYRIRRADGAIRWMESRLYPILEPDGSCHRVVGLNQDVTEQHEAGTALRERSEQLERSLREKDALLTEIHHRVKNNLQAISGLVHLMAAQAGARPLEETIADLERRIQAMALVHETLYRSADLAAVDMDAYLRRLGSTLVASMSPDGVAVQLAVAADRIALDLDSAVRVGFIANELIGNAQKHAFRGRSRGRIDVSLKATERDMTLRVSDDGVGFPDDLSFGSEHTLGLRLVAGLADQLNGVARRAAGTRSTIEIVCARSGALVAQRAP